MSFKLYSDSIVDRPLLACDTCGQKIVDIWNDKASGTPSKDGNVTDVVIHHAKCAGAGTVHMQLIDFIRLFAIQNRIGDLGSIGGADKLTIEFPTGKGFKA